MHVVMLSDAETSGGAAIAASRLAEALIWTGVRVTRIVGYPDRQGHPWATRALKIPLLVRQRLQHLLMKLHPDIINVHNLHGARWSPDLLAICARHAPTVWTLHDMWSFTGRCAYNYDCRKFVQGCDATCPTSTEYPALSPNRIMGAWRRREQLFAKYPNLVAVCPSRWMAQEAIRGLWRGHRVEVIPNGLPLGVYGLIDKRLARMTLGIETSAPVVLSAAENLNERRKGGKILVEALRKVRTRPLALITLGRGSLPIAAEGITLYSLGYIDHERRKVLAFNAADLLVHPAPVDNLPNTVMESIACGTPVVGFAVGGVPDMVRPGQTGWLAKEASPETLSAKIDVALGDISHGMNLRESCRAIAETEYSSDLQAQRYLKLFESL